MTRKVPLSRVENFRDFGDYPTRDGRRIRRGLLYRSAHQQHATDEDLEIIAGIAPHAIVDLRRRLEREKAPSRRWPEFAATVIENDLGDLDHDPWMAEFAASDGSVEWFRQNAMGFYRQTPFEDRYIDLFSRYFHVLGEAKGPVLVHCAAGKDRTGTICALTHYLLGVDHEHIVADFLLTNDHDRVATRAPELRDIFLKEAGRDVEHAALVQAISVEVSYLDAAFETIRTRCGSVDAYLRDVLGIDAELKERLEARLLE
ncbi:MAG: tyrosine-protein phosphatase [Caulobacteraceae bacterium]